MAEQKDEKKSAPAAKPAAAKAAESKPAAKAAPARAPKVEQVTSNVILHPITTEKAVGGIESRNEICVAVIPLATKKGIRSEAESLFGAKVGRVRTSTSAGVKKAFIKFVKQGEAADVASRLKMI